MSSRNVAPKPAEAAPKPSLEDIREDLVLDLEENEQKMCEVCRITARLENKRLEGKMGKMINAAFNQILGIIEQERSTGPNRNADSPEEQELDYLRDCGTVSVVFICCSLFTTVFCSA
jgi:hypothetical protein